MAEWIDQEPSAKHGIQAPALLAPAGDWDCVRAAVENGADAVYFGLDRFNARMRATNFTIADLPGVMEFLHRRGVKGYVTLNTLVFTDELKAAEQYIGQIIAAGTDAIIVQDVGIAGLIRHLSPDFPIHASTQMTVTSANGVAFAHQLGCEVVVLARECSIKELAKIQQQLAQRSLSVALEVFVHGALCVAYSGQCLTSESLGGRSANRGECAQACRMTYDLVVDGKPMDLGDRHYLLSPQDLAGLDLLPDLIQAGVACLKIEGRLKSPEYVASVTQVYRTAIDKIMAQWSSPGLGKNEARSPKPEELLQCPNSERDRYQLEMAFSRGLYTGWFAGINNQALVHGRYGKKRGVYLGTVLQVEMPHPGRNSGYVRAAVPQPNLKRPKRGQGRSPHHAAPLPSSPLPHSKPRIVVQLESSIVPLKPGDGVMFDGGHPNGQEEGGRLYTVDYQHKPGSSTQGNRAVLTFGPNSINPQRIQPGDRLWKTSDPALDKEVRQSFSGDTPHFCRPITIRLRGQADSPLEAIAQDESGHWVQIQSAMALVPAHSNPLTSERLHQQFSRLGHTPFTLAQLDNRIDGEVMLPVSELNRLRRELVEQLLMARSHPTPWTFAPDHCLTDLLPSNSAPPPPKPPTLIPLLRSLPQLIAALDLGYTTVYCEFEDPRRYKEAVQRVRAMAAQTGQACTIWVAPPRITKPLENWLLEQVRSCGADGYLVRNYDHLAYFEGDRCIGDFSLNVANPLTAQYFWQQHNLERLTASYDLNIQQLEQLLSACPSHWFEVTLHQHMPMFHMEHCVFCAFLSEGTDFTNCGRPCETHEVKLRDRTGAEHRLHADAGCRNTVYNSRAQTGVESLHRLLNQGLQHIRIEFLDESPDQVKQTLGLYQRVLEGTLTGTELWQRLRLQNQLGVTRGPLDA